MIDLTDGRAVDLDTHLSGGWGPTQLIDLPAGESRPFGGATTETCLYVINGHVALEVAGGSRDVHGGTGIALIKGTETVITAHEDARVFVATLTT